MKTKKEEFIEIYETYIKKEGSKELLDFLKSDKSDFFTAPASTRYHLAYEGGLVEHSLNVFYALKDYLNRPVVKNDYLVQASDESIAIAALLHDLCKVNVYQKSSRNVKDSKGTWVQVPTYEYKDQLPYGHGEKSVYMITGYMKLSREEAFAIRYHMGFSNVEEKQNVSQAFSMFPLAFALSVADMEATFYIENTKE